MSRTRSSLFTPVRAGGENGASTATLPEIGSVLAGKYRIDRVLGQGGMGIVYEAFHLRLRQRVALKMLLPDALAEPEFVARFDREARASATLVSPNIATVFDVDTSPEGLPYMVIEYLEGHDLSVELATRGPLPVDEAVGRVLEACVPIAQAHSRGIIHRDLKPANLFLARNGQRECLKLIDFGISKVLADVEKMTMPTQGLGTPHYMSPEQVRQASDVDQRSDIWSLGVILYELLTGATPFDGASSAVIAAIVADPLPLPRTLRPDIPEALEVVIMGALEKDLSKRFQDVDAFALALAPFAAGTPRSTSPTLLRTASAPPSDRHSLVATHSERANLSLRRRPRLAWLMVPAAAALLLGGWLATPGLSPPAAAAPSTRGPRASVMMASTLGPIVASGRAPAPAALPPPASAPAAARATARPPRVIETAHPAAIDRSTAPSPPVTNPLTL